MHIFYHFIPLLVKIYGENKIFNIYKAGESQRFSFRRKDDIDDRLILYILLQCQWWTSSEAKQTNRPHRMILWLMILFYFITFWLNEARKDLQELYIWFVFLINYFPRLHRWLIIFLLGINSLIKDDTLKQPPDLTGTTSSTDGICSDDHHAEDLIISDIFPTKYFLETLETWWWSLLKFLP